MTHSDLEADSVGDIREALSRICASEYFAEAEQIKRFLRYVVEEALAGRAERIKSYSVGVEALGKDTDFDPTQDPIVRITANRLRSALAKYYNESQDEHRVIIRLPKGHYFPEFDFRPERDRPDHLSTQRPASPPSATPSPARGRLAVAFLAVAVLAIAVLIFWSRLSVADSDGDIGRVWIIVQPVETGGSTDRDFARVLGDQIIAQVTRYDGVSIIDALRSPNSQRSADQMSGSGWTEKHVFSLATYVRIEDGRAALRWYLTDMHSNQVMWASDRNIGFETGDGAAAIVQSISAELLGLEGAVPVILDRSQPTDLGDDSVCIARAQRNAFTDDLMLLGGVADCLKRVVDHHPQNGQAWALLSLAYHRQGRFAASQGEDASAYRVQQQVAADRASALSPETFFPHLARLAAAYDAGQGTALQNLADRMLLRYSGDARLKVMIGKAFVSQGLPERGLPLIEAGLNQIPSLGPLGYTMLALERYVADDLERAVQYIDEQKLPDDYRYWLMKTVIDARSGNLQEARLAWAGVIRLKPGYSEFVCGDLRASNIHNSYYNRIVEDLNKVVPDLPPDTCGPSARTQLVQSDP
ncbi:hypothetical protein NIM87_04445 [Devosia sp. XJ19-1]|uniref:Adenylate cyclase n=1 Tax=Devosia ureilytica TaxID=2952754 RepID=A0A9Q4AMK1_9HYPH|nr:hypothetical protein [Devosia ureilytica]MCP8882738.1 hypothetical protein [Devosia ureilytica]MCP8886894.1 hypothetical protein [Devosia ureilytica]